MRNAGFESEILDETGDKVDQFAVLDKTASRVFLYSSSS